MRRCVGCKGKLHYVSIVAYTYMYSTFLPSFTLFFICKLFSENKNGYWCIKCLEPTWFKGDDAKKHRDVHPSPTGNWCMTCNARFDTRKDRDRHRNDVCTVRRHKCDWPGCNSAFTTSSAMRHICFPFSANLFI